MMIADINVPWTTTTQWIAGAIGALTVACMILTMLNQGRKFFGRKPPMDEQLAHLDRSLRKDMKEGDKLVERQISALRSDVNEQFQELTEARRDHNTVLQRSFDKIEGKLEEQTIVLTSSAERRSEATNEKLGELRVAIGKLDERTKKL